jgi:hypothetical protein
MALAWMFDVSEAGADCMFSIEEKICRNGQTLVLGTAGRMHDRTEGASHDRLACRGGEFRDDLNAPSLERYFRARNAPYSLDDPGNPLKSQQMRPPSERTKGNKPLMRKIFSRFLLPHCYSQRALVFVPRNLPCLVSRVLVQCLLLRSSHFFEPTPRENHHLHTRG